MQTQAHLLDLLEPQSDSPLLEAEWESVLSEKKSAEWVNGCEKIEVR